MDSMVEPIIFFQIIYFHYIIWSSSSWYQTHSMLWYCMIWISCLIFLYPLDSVNSSSIQFCQHHLQLPFLTAMPLFSTKKYLKFHLHFQIVRCQITFSYRMYRSQVCIFISIGKDLEVVTFQMIDLSHYWNSSFY